MEVSRGPKPDVFTPFDITITFQTIEEAHRFYAIFNHAWVTQGSDMEDASRDIRRAMQEECYNNNSKYHKLLGDFMKERCKRELA